MGERVHFIFKTCQQREKPPLAQIVGIAVTMNRRSGDLIWSDQEKTRYSQIGLGSEYTQDEEWKCRLIGKRHRRQDTYVGPTSRPRSIPSLPELTSYQEFG